MTTDKKGTARFRRVKNKALVTPFYVYVPAPHPALTGFGTGIFANLQIFFVYAKKKEGKMELSYNYVPNSQINAYLKNSHTNDCLNGFCCLRLP